MIQFSADNKKLLEELKKFNSETYFHCVRVKALTLRMIRYINENVAEIFTQKQIDSICKGAFLHDVGKLYVKNVILTKRDRLTPEERESINYHTLRGMEAIKPEEDEEEYKIVSDICLYHHERVDGQGQSNMRIIPFYVQIVSICDAFDALRSERVYHAAIDVDTALAMIRDGKCGAFSEKLVEYLFAIAKEEEE